MKIIDKYKNKYFSILGDSISTFEGYSVPKDAYFYDLEKKQRANVTLVSQTWWGKVIDILGGRLLVNNSISGSTVAWHSSYEIQSYGCSDERTSSLARDEIMPDVIMVYIGTNDWGCGIQLLPKSDDNCEDTAIFSIAYSKMLEKIRNNYPKAEIWCFTLATSCFSISKTFEFPYYSGGWHMSKYCDVIKSCAEKYDCKVIDLFCNSNPYDTIDGFHPNADGMQTLAEAVLNSL